MMSPEDYTVGLFCPLVIEARAMQNMLDEIHSKTGSIGVRYILGQLSGHHVVLATLPFTSRGKVSMAIAASQMKHEFPNIAHFLLVGLGGGMPSSSADIHLGDVVISMPTGTHPGVVQYDSGKLHKAHFERTGCLLPPPEKWLLAISRMQVDNPVVSGNLAQWITDLQQRCGRGEFRRPSPDTDRLFRSTYDHPKGQATCARCNRHQVVERRVRRDPTKPVIHYGLILTSDMVIRNADERDRAAKAVGGAICFDMEAAAMMSHYSCLVIRGICDYADTHKNDVWHQYAAAAAAAMAKEILRYIEPTTPQFLGQQNSTAANPTSHAVFSGNFHAHTMSNINSITTQGSVHIG
ncbi:purine and uridine phosphorylase [Aspergillus phoenicis ATCC 13157]|uniref:Purine and uridine phosphorylase n=1 Tax=Aspergillus phoenicis ATCC 13157 TaxID=1353007 RepID=A0A370P892_ASPPH|nr:purine and uridine phosphorylase [Aspergillus phoenicis ATCC 13157]